MLRTRLWIILLAALLLVCLGLSAWLLRPRTQVGYAQIRSDGELLYTISLAEDQQFTIRTEYGSNTVTVRDGKIAVTEADCPDGFCVRRGFCDGGASIICLPHRLEIRFTDDAQIDAAA